MKEHQTEVCLFSVNTSGIKNIDLKLSCQFSFFLQLIIATPDQPINISGLSCHM